MEEIMRLRGTHVEGTHDFVLHFAHVVDAYSNSKLKCV